VWAWGQNDLGEVGNGCTEGVNCSDVTAPYHVSITNVIAVSGGDCHSAALKGDGTVWTWGCNHHNGTNPAVDPVGQLGNGDATYTDSTVPVQVHGPNNVGYLTGIVAIAARDYHNYALRSDGTLWSWGSNLNGQLGTGTCCTPSAYPVQVLLP
jgi:alpha-tubulin suppressor-like RCC1 family protein